MYSLYIWGIGALYKRKKHNLKDMNIEGYIDNKLCLKGELFEGKKVISSSEITADMSIIVMVESFVSMAYELIDRGITDFEIGSYLFPESYQEQLLKESGSFEVENQQLVYRMNTETIKVRNQEDINNIYRKLVKAQGFLDSLNKFPDIPICRNFGITRGTPVDRIYIEKFLDKYKLDVRGDVLEIAENTYTLKYGEDRLEHSYMLHVKGWGKNVICGNLETGEGIKENQFDSAILTQTMMFIFNLDAVAKNIYKMLKPGGTALITVSGISQISRYDAENWGCYWGFYKDSLMRLFQKYFEEKNIVIETYGNVKTATALLYGLCAEELSKEAFDKDDEQYPVVYGIRVNK